MRRAIAREVRERLNRRQIMLLKTLARHGGHRAIAIARYLQDIAATMWRRELVEIWYRQVPEQPSLRGPFYALSLAGWKLASSFLDDRIRDVAPAPEPARRPRRPKMQISNYDPAKPGQGFQGDVSIVPIPFDLSVATVDEIKPSEGRLILQAGEATGHHHAIYLLANIPRFHVATDELHGQPRRLLEVTIAGEPVRVIEVMNGSLEPDGTRRKFLLGAARNARTRHLPETPAEAVANSYGIAPEHYREQVRT